MYHQIIGFNQHQCDTCGIIYFLTPEFEDARIKDRKGFYCPNGHQWWFIEESNEQKLRKRLVHTEKEFESCMMNLKQTVKTKEQQVKSLRGKANYYKGRSIKLSAKKETP